MSGTEVTAVAAARRGWYWPQLAASFFLFGTSGAFSILDRLLYGEWSGKSGDKLTQILNLLQIAAALALFVRGYLSTRRLTTGALVALGFVAFLCSTMLWSVEPAITLRRGVLYALFVLGTIGIADNFDGDGFMALLRTLCGVCAVISLVGIVVSPGNVLSPGGGELRGPFVYKGVLGQVMAVGVLAALHGLRTDGRRLLGLTLLAMFLVTSLLAHSGTALVTIVLSCIFDLTATLLRRRGAARVLGLLLCVLMLPLALSLILAPGLFLGALGKDPTLTGRTVLWQYVDFYIAQRPLLGWGLAAFWSPDNPLANGVSDAVGWSVPEAHNAVLEILLEFGVLGGVVFLALFLRNILLALRCLGTSGHDLGQSALLCHLGMVMVGVTEEVLVDQSQIYVPVFFVTGLICDRMLLSMRETGGASGVLRHEPAW